MSKPAAKNIPRALRHELRRTALLEQLNAKADFPVIALLAPSGYGKTTTLAQLARQGSRAVAWLTLTEEEASTDALGTSIAHALERTLTDIEFGTWKGIQFLPTTDEVKARALAEDLNTSNENVIVVLDRTEHLGANGAKWLEAFVNNLNEGHQVMLAGYESTPLPLARWVAQGEAWVIGTDELAFSGEEVMQLMAEHERSVNALDLHQHLEGWPAGIALIAAGAPTHLAPKDLVLERLDHLPKKWRDGLTEMSVIEEWDEALPKAFDINLPRGWLKQVLAAGLPLSLLGAGRYRAHTVLLEALETRLLERPEAHRARHAHAGKQAVQAGQKLTALRHFIAAGLFDIAFDLARVVTNELYAQRNFETVRQVIERFGTHLIPTDLRVSFAQVLFETGDTAAGDVLLNELYALGHRSAELLYRMASRANVQARFQAQLTLLEEALTLADNPATRANILLLTSDGLEYLGQPKESLEAARLAVVHAEGADDLPTLAKALSRLGGALGNVGERVESEKLYLQAYEMYASLGMVRRNFEVLNNLANFYNEWGQFERALETIDRALNIQGIEEDSWYAVLLGTRGLIRLRWGYSREAVKDFGLGLEIGQRRGMDRFRFNYNVWLCEAACLAGDMTVAKEAFNEAGASLPATSAMHLGWFGYLQGFWAFHSGNDQEAFEVWQTVNIEGLEADNQARIVLYRAEINRRRDALTEQQIEQVFSFWDVADQDAILVREAQVLKSLFETCIQNDWFPQRFQAVLDRKLKTTSTNTTTDLHLSTFGSTVVTINQTPIKLPLVKCAELLAWLILNGPSTRNAIVNALWDGSRRKADVEHARIVIRRLRAALSEHPDVNFNPLEFDGTQYGLNKEFQISCDAKTVLDSSGSASIEPSVLEILNAYNGSFLEGCDTDWVQEMTTQLTDATINGFVTLGRQYEVTHIEQALEAYQRAIKLDPLAVSAYEGIVRVQSQLGNTAAVQQTHAMLEQSEKRNLLN